MCAIKHRWDPKSGKSETDQVIPIVVGPIDDKDKEKDKSFEWEAKRLPADDDAQKKDAKKEGLRLTLQGGTYQQRAQRTVVEFRCNPDVAGTEGEWESLDEYEPVKGQGEEKEKKNGRREEKKEGDESTPEQQLKKDGAALVWQGYKREKGEKDLDMDTLYLTWYTKSVCDAAADQPAPEQESSHWGFFTWFVILYALPFITFLFYISRCKLLTHTASFSPSHRTSSSAPGSTTRATAPAAGTCSRTATPSATCPTC